MLFLPLLFQRRLLARFRKESLGGVSHSDGHSVVMAKKKPVHQNQPQQNFRSAEASLMYRPCISQVPKEGCAICVIQLAHLHENLGSVHTNKDML